MLKSLKNQEILGNWMKLMQLENNGGKTKTRERDGHLRWRLQVGVVEKRSAR